MILVRRYSPNATGANNSFSEFGPAADFYTGEDSNPLFLPEVCPVSACCPAALLPCPWHAHTQQLAHHPCVCVLSTPRTRG